MLINLNGKLVDKKDAVVSVFDHGLLYGDGVFEGIRIYSGNIFKLKEHVDRLFDSAKYIMLDIGMTKEKVIKETVRTAAKSGIKNGYIRLVVTRGEGDLGLDPRKCSKPTYFVIVSTIQLYPEKFYREGLSITTVAVRRNVNEALNPQVKSLNYLNNILAKIEANNHGSLEAVMINEQGYVSEATGDNIFIVKNGKLITPPLFTGVLKGITRDAVVSIAKKLKIRVSKKVLTRYELYTADELFMTGTAAEVIPVVKVDSRLINGGTPGKMTKKLMTEFKKITKVMGTKVKY